MAQLVREAQLAPITRETAIRILASQHPINYVDAARRMLGFVRRNVKRLDEGVEFIQRPEWLLTEIRDGRTPWGDCDDVSTLLATLTTSIGIPARFVAVRRPGGDYQHVFPEVHVAGRWQMADPQNDQMPPGDWETLMVEI